MTPLLQEPRVNPHATLITLFVDVVAENMPDKEIMLEFMPMTEASRRLTGYLGTTSSPGGQPATDNDKSFRARPFVISYDHILER